MNDDTIGRRGFLKGAAATMMLFLTEEELFAARLFEDPPPVQGPPVKFGLVGVGQWGREILSTLSRLPSAQVTAICDVYEPYLKKAQEIAPKAVAATDYRKLLESPEVEAVVVATPSHLHKEIAIAALQAGKHVYCEAPLATTVEDAKAIALEALGAPKLVFQAGLQGRSNALYNHVSNFVKSGVLGTPVQVTAQWNKKQSWRRVAPTPEREQELNWRLSSKTSAGLMGEVGVHQMDLVNWYLKSLPTGVMGFGSVVNWNDGRDVADTVQCIFEYPKNVRVTYTSTLASSFSDAFTLFQGSNSSLMMREKRGWMTKESDSPLLGWEVYARKEPVHNETAIAMVADATKILAAGGEPGKEGSAEPSHDALYLALEDFARGVRGGPKPPSGPEEGYQAAVVAIKANEAISTGTRITYQPAWFTLK
jgi:predicted dehydrogenase